MSDEADQNNQIAMFMEISGTDFETAQQTLTANNFNLEQAINFHLERSNVLNIPDDDANDSNSPMTASTSSGLIPNLPLDDGEEVRAPILPKREQMILPGEDNFRYRKRRTANAFRTSVCPLRNFQLEGQMQEERLQAAVLGNFIAVEANDDGDDMAFASLPTASNPISKSLPVGFSADTKKALQTKISGNSVQPAAPSRLSELFRPPVDISFCGSFQAARDYAKEQNRWLIVNVQDMNDFNCQILNRDIWSSEKLREIIKKYFIFLQVAIDNVDGHRFQVFYGLTVFPYIGIIDPRTGEEKLSYKQGFNKTLSEFTSELRDMPIDMWSLGCILAELLTGYALFPGEDENDQLACIIELLGMPPQKLLDQSKRAKNFFSAKGYPRYCMVETLDDGRVILGSGTSRQGKERGPPGSKSLKKALKGCDDPLFMNFLCGCLEWDPEFRMTPAAALKHSWFRRRLPRPPQSTNASASTTGSSTALTGSPVTSTTNASATTVATAQVVTATAHVVATATTQNKDSASGDIVSNVANVINANCDNNVGETSSSTSITNKLRVLLSSSNDNNSNTNSNLSSINNHRSTVAAATTTVEPITTATNTTTSTTNNSTPTPST